MNENSLCVCKAGLSLKGEKCVRDCQTDYHCVTCEGKYKSCSVCDDDTWLDSTGLCVCRPGLSPLGKACVPDCTTDNHCVGCVNKYDYCTACDEDTLLDKNTGFCECRPGLSLSPDKTSC